jgi:hypothetical protein
VRRNAVLRVAPVSDAFSVVAFMNVLRIDICSSRPKREVQFLEALMFKGYQCWNGGRRWGGGAHPVAAELLDRRPARCRFPPNLDSPPYAKIA